MSRVQNPSKKSNKLQQQSISLFQYYTQSLFPNIFSNYNFPPTTSGRYKTCDKNITYNYLCQPHSSIKDVSYSSILQSAKHAYFIGEGAKIKQNIFIKKSDLKVPYLPSWTTISQKIEIFLLEQNPKTNPPKNNKILCFQGDKLIKQNQIKYNTNRSIIYSLYIVHQNQSYPNHTNLLWQNFIEKYTFTPNLEEGSYQNYSLVYQAVFSYSNQYSLFSFDHSTKLLQQFYEKSVFSENLKTFPVLEKLYRSLRNITESNNLKRTKQLQSPSFDPSHRRELRLTPKQLFIFQSLKLKTFSYFTSLNKNRSANAYMLQNMICRMMQSQQYKQEQSWTQIKHYLQFQKRMRDKYTWNDFQQYNKMNIFSYIGKDTMGRPIIINRLRNNLMSQIKNIDHYFDYHTYIFQIYMQDQMQGWVDQFTFLVDMSNQVSDNTNVGFTKRLCMEALKVIIGRTFQIVIFDMNYVGVVVTKLLKPLIPKAVAECFKIIGDDRVQLLKQLRLSMSDQVIPQFLGGNNRTIETSQKVNNLSMLNTEQI